MANNPNPLGDLGKEGVESALALAKVAMESAERMVRLQLDAARDLVQETAGQAQKLAGVSDPQQIAEARAQAADAAMQKALAWSQELTRSALETQGALAKVMEERVARFNAGMLTAMEQTLSGAPGSDAALAAMRTAMAASAAAVGNLTRAAQQFGGMAADTALKSARDAASAAKPGSRRK